jgi:hypothetical protein
MLIEKGESFMKNQLSNSLRIRYSSTFDISETEEITQALSKICPVEESYLFVKSESTVAQTLVVIVLGYIGCSVADSFFQAMGSDIYKLVKDKIKKVFKDKENPTIKFEMSYKKTEISIESHDKEGRILDGVFDTIDKARDIAIHQLNKETTPSLTKITITHNNDGWQPTSGQQFEPKNYPYPKYFKFNQVTGKWEIEKEFADELKKLLTD